MQMRSIGARYRMIERLVRSHLRTFESYRSARSEMDGLALEREFIYLDANELATGSPVSFNDLSLNRYPDPFQRKLRTAIGSRFGIGIEKIFLGVGSDEIIDLLVRLLCEPANDSVVILEPTYGVYGVSASLNNVKKVSVPLDGEFQIDIDATLKAVTPETKIIFCCSPNNPTGNVLRKADILKLADSVQCLVVVDQAYDEFAGPEQVLHPSDLEKRENLLILKTLSKAWGSAGIRLGYCFAHPDLVSYLMRIKAPYNINALTLSAALKAVASEEFMLSSVKEICRERERLVETLKTHPHVLRIYPSDANFILVQFRDPKTVYDRLLNEGIIVRRRSEPLLQHCLRITVGTANENSLLLNVLSNIR